jgi:hypothetical protein
MVSIFLFAVSVGSGVITAVQARTWFVPDDFPTIQGAIDAASAGDIVEVWPETYSPSTNGESFPIVMKSGVTLDGTGGPEVTIIDAEQQDRVLTCVDFNATIEGFTITGGHVLGGPSAHGGGLYCNNSSPMISDCIFLDNFSENDGGGLTCELSGPILTNCIFRSNSASSMGGGAASFWGSPHFIDCVFADNAAPSGGGLYLVYSPSEFRGCTFMGNTADWGGALAGSDPVGSHLARANEPNEADLGTHRYRDRTGPTLLCCTLYDNSASTGSGIAHNWYDIPVLSNTIVADGRIGEAIANMAGLMCCDLYGNEGGDWVGPIQPQYGVTGNISADPFFCDPDDGILTLRPESPCAAENNPECGQIGAYGIGCTWGITAIEDVPNDQGRQVRVTWWANAYDAADSDTVITQYSIWRRIDQIGRWRGSGIDGTLAVPLFPDGEWDYVLSVPALGEQSYNAVCPTLCDSTITDGICWSVFLVTAETDTPPLHYECAPDSGYSVDNLAPEPPTNLRWEGTDILAWEESEVDDFDYFAVYGSASGAFDSEEADLIGYTIETTMDVTGTDYAFYHTTGTDFSGNEGDAATIEAEAMALGELMTLPSAFMLHPCHPNPFNPATLIRFDLPEDAPVRLQIYDPTGRLVQTLVDNDAHRAGRFWIEWNGQDSIGRPVGSGTYFCRLSSDGFCRTTSMTLVR